MVAIATQAVRNIEIERPLLPQLSGIAESSYMSDEHVHEALNRGWLQAIDEFLDDHLLTEEEEGKLDAFRDQYQLSVSIVQSPQGERLLKARGLREILEGGTPTHPKTNGSEVFNFQKSERLLWVFEGVRYLEDKTRRHYTGGSSGASIRVAKGLYWRVGAFKGYPVETTETVQVGTGPLAVTTKHLYFHCPQKAFRIRHDKIVSITPYSDGIGVQRDAASAKPQKFITGDGWFLYNLMQNASNLE